MGMIGLWLVAEGFSDKVAQTLAWGTVLILAILALGILVLWLRKKYLAGRQPCASETFDIAGVEAMHRRGLISDAEFKRLRLKALGLDAPGGESGISSSRGGGGNDDNNAAASASGPEGREE